jgi:cholesterol oxidase
MELERMSLPLHEMADHYEAVIVGSGYGGGIAAARLAEAGVSVCLLERGQELHPGEYPSGAASAPKHIQANLAQGRIGSPTALIDFHMGSDMGVVRGCGLGGTSLINANVALEADPSVFNDARWPAELINTGAAVLAPYYALATAMLGSAVPASSLLGLPKTNALGRSALAVGAAVQAAPLNVTFTAGTNAAGIDQNACTLCGDCISGCNHSAKNTVLMNYLPYAYQRGAKIFCEVAVRTVQKQSNGKWLVEFADHTRGQRRFGSPTRFVSADVVVLAAGSLGSTEILLRSRAAGLVTSPRLGHSFTGNGDVFAFAFDGDTKLNSVGLGNDTVTPTNAVGPCIAGTATVALPPPHGKMLIQEGSVPGATGFVSSLVWALSALLFGQDGTSGATRLRKRLSQLIRSLFGSRFGPPSRSMTYLVMSIDDDGGELLLDGDRLDIKWPDVEERPVVKAINETLKQGAVALGGAFVPNPMWATPVGAKLLTVQPLGGCDMGDDATHGVCNHKGQVFAGTTGASVHDGLYVADGAVIPRPLGANPSLTISAIAERIVEKLVEDRYANGSPGPSPTPINDGPGVRFSERMAGYFSKKVKQGYKAGAEQGKADRSPIELVCTITYSDLEPITNGAAVADVIGTVFAPALSPQRLVATGSFRLFVPDPRFVETWHMRYDLKLRAESGETFGLHIFKLLRERGSLDAWGDTTTAYAKVIDSAGAVAGVGIVRISTLDFIRQILTIDAPDAPDNATRWSVRMSYMRMFVKKLLSMYGGPLDTAGEFPPPSPPALPSPTRPLTVTETSRHWCKADLTWSPGTASGADAIVQLIRFKGGTKGPVVLSCGFAMSATSFLLDTIDCNLVEFLCAKGYDVWLFDNRGGITMPGNKQQHSLDDIAKVDWPQAVAKVQQETNAADVQVVAHCAGALTFQMAMLAGLQGVRSAVCSALTVYFRPNRLKKFLNGLGIEGLIAGIGIEGFNPPKRATPLNKIIDVLLRLYPVPRGERCGQAICRWVNGIYGCTHHHAQLNDPTHKALWSLFGFGNFSAGRQFASMFKEGKVLDRDGNDTYLNNNTNLPRLAIPMLFLHGEDNQMFHPDGSKDTMDKLRTRNPLAHYERESLPGYGHLDVLIGRNAATDVYPLIERHLTAHP